MKMIGSTSPEVIHREDGMSVDAEGYALTGFFPVEIPDQTHIDAVAAFMPLTEVQVGVEVDLFANEKSSERRRHQENLRSIVFAQEQARRMAMGFEPLPPRHGKVARAAMAIREFVSPLYRV